MDLVVRHSLPGLASLEVVGVIDDIDAREVYATAPGHGKAPSIVALPGDLVIVVRLRPDCRPGPVHYLPEGHASPPCRVAFDKQISAWTGVLSRVTCADCMRSRKFLSACSSSSDVAFRRELRDRRVGSSRPSVDQDLADHEALVSGDQDLVRREEQ
jgi:hypothetical protein